MPNLRADTARFTLQIEALEDEMLVIGLRGVEQLSSPYRFELELACENHELDFASIINQPALLVIDGEDEPRYLHAMVSRFEQGDQGVRFSTYYATLVPRLWYLAQRHNCRIFQEMDVKQIIEQVLKDAGYKGDDFRFVLEKKYEKREYCVQYRESELNFISRLMEEEGICYFFEHTGDTHALVIADGASAFNSITGNEAVIFRTSAGVARNEEHVYRYRYSEEVRPGAVRYRDYNFKKPDLNLQTEFEADANTNLEVYDYPGNYADTKIGKTRAQVRLEELQAVRKTGHGESDCVRLLPGFKFTLDEHTREEFNRDYLLTEVRQTGRQPQALGEGASSEGFNYDNVFVCIPADVPYRPARITRKPVMEGAQTAIVVGPKGEEIYTDEHGRVKVQFHWDRDGEANEKSSCWIRTSSAWAGAGWGAISIPRIGHEVIVDFLEGDPDRPIITGRVYHGTNRPPYALPDEKTKSTLKSNSSKGGEGFNEIRLEDRKGEEQIFVHAEKNQDIRVKNDRFEWTGHNRHLMVEQDKFEHIENNRNEQVENDHLEEIKNDRNLKVGGKQAIGVDASHSFTVKGDVIEVFKANHSEQTTQNYYLKAMGIVIESTSGITLKCGGSNVVIDPSGVSIKGPMVTIDGGLVKIASGPGSPPKSGSAGQAVAPSGPDEAIEADNADPGKVSETKSKKIAAQEKEIPFKPISSSSGTKSSEAGRENEETEEEKTWIEIELVDEEDNPVPGEKYKITLPDERVKTGTLDENGFARVEGIDPGTCKVTFPNLDKDAWEKA